MDKEKQTARTRLSTHSAEWDAVASTTRRAMQLTAALNRLTFDDGDKMREVFSELTGKKVDDTFTLIPPFYSAYGLDLRIGRKVFINQCCTIYDMGGVDIGDEVMIGPNVNIITTGHAVDPAERRAFIETSPIVIERNVWIAAAVTIIGGVTIGENSVIAAGSVVTRNVPANSLAAGVPARVIRALGEGPNS